MPPLNWVRQCAKSAIPPSVRGGVKRLICPQKPWSKFGRLSFSQEGEDLILARLFGNRTAGFYVDVGAHHPWRFSNTFLFYKRGWQGINIDPRPGSKQLFDHARPRDISLELAISSSETDLEYFEFNAPELNGFTKDAPVALKYPDKYFVTGSRIVHALPLHMILKQHLPPSQSIDFLTVDVEGHDLAVLESNDWEQFRPSVVVAECRGALIGNVLSEPVSSFLTQRGYAPFAKAFHSWIFVDHDFEHS